MTEQKKISQFYGIYEHGTFSNLYDLFAKCDVTTWDKINLSKVSPKRMQNDWEVNEHKSGEMFVLKTPSHAPSPYFFDGVLHLFNTKTKYLGAVMTENTPLPTNTRIYTYYYRGRCFESVSLQEPENPTHEMIILDLGVRGLADFVFSFDV